MRNKHLLSLILAAAVTASCTIGFAGDASTKELSVAAADDNNDDWLHCEGSRIFDKDGNEVWLTGANWFGFNCSERCPHYLYAGDCDDMLRECADRGINIIRFPFSSELLVEMMNGELEPVSGGGLQACYNPPVDTVGEDGTVTPAGKYGCINKDFVEADGKTHVDSKKAFEIILGKLKKYGMKCFIDVHSPHADNSGHNYNLWYGKAGITTDLWIESLVWMANEYKNDDTLLGFDLENEPHGKGPEGEAAAKWDGSTDENNWAYAATKCANAILKVNPNALILVEGVEQSMSGAKEGDYWGMADRVVMHEGDTPSPYIGAWWGGNLRGVRKWPIKLDGTGNSQLIYSPHDYGPSVYNQTWFAKDFTTETLLEDYWRDTWEFINHEDIAPLLIGEWGGHMDGAENQKWMTLLRDYMIDHHINHTFWCLNTNSGDTGGLWKNISWDTTACVTKLDWEEDKYELFEKSLWQTASGKYIGLDHKTPLGKNGLSLSEFYASGEKSNLDGGSGGTHGNPVTIVTSPDEPKQTDAPAVETTQAPKQTDAPTVQTTAAPAAQTTETTARQRKWGDIDLSGNVDVSDAVLISRYGVGDDSLVLTDEGLENADVTGDNRVSSSDASKVIRYIVGLITEVELAP